MLLFKKSIPVTLYQSCATMPMQAFIDLQVEKDLKYLTITGTPTAEQLFNQWLDIKSEYDSLVKDTQNEYLFTLRKNIEYQDKRLVIITALINFMRTSDNPEGIALLQETTGFGYSYADKLTDLHKTESRLKTDIQRLKSKESEYLKLTESGTQAEIDRMYYADQLGVLSDFQGYRFDAGKQTVMEYCSLLNRFRDDVEAKKKLYEKHGR